MDNELTMAPLPYYWSQGDPKPNSPVYVVVDGVERLIGYWFEGHVYGRQQSIPSGAPVISERTERMRAKLLEYVEQMDELAREQNAPIDRRKLLINGVTAMVELVGINVQRWIDGTATVEVKFIPDDPQAAVEILNSLGVDE